MSDTLEIKSANGASALEIAPSQTTDPACRPEYLDVTPTGARLRASTRIYNLDQTGSVGSLPVFLEDVARNWRGWLGEKHWESVESDLKLICTSSPLDNITMFIMLDSYVDDPFIRDVRCSLVLESWQLDPPAAQAKKVLQI